MKTIKKQTILKFEDFDGPLTERNILSMGSECIFLPTLFCCFQNDERLFLVMEYISGGDLLFHISKVWI